MSGDLRHPIFARVFHRLSGVMEQELAPLRDELLAGLSGRVLELGAGNGVSFPHYPGGVEELVAVEPEPYLRARAARAAGRAPIAVTVVDAAAGALPLPDASFDAAVCSLVLCSVADQAGALEDLRRVLRPGGELRFFEHVRSATPRRARIQERMDRTGIWSRLAGGCHCARDTGAAIERGGFGIERMRRVAVGPRWVITNPHLLGRALAA